MTRDEISGMFQAFVDSFTKQLGEMGDVVKTMSDRMEEDQKARQRETRLKKAGIPDSLAPFLKDDADLESLSGVLSGLTGPAAPAAAPTPTLPQVGTKNPGGEVLDVTELLARATENNDAEAVKQLKLAQLAQVSKNLI